MVITGTRGIPNIMGGVKKHTPHPSLKTLGMPLQTGLEGE